MQNNQKTLIDIAPQNKSGWPWDYNPPQIPPTMPNGSPWPKISIVTPSFNQGQFIEETIRSVLLQGYPNLEYIIIDGGSTDGSVDIIKKYEPWLTYWVSEPDRGQSEALNKGIQKSSGFIFSWINSDDLYLPGILPDRVEKFLSSQDTVILYGDLKFIDESSNYLQTWRPKQTTCKKLLIDGNQIPQPGTIIRFDSLRAIGGLDPGLDFVMDYTLWLRLSMVGHLDYLPGEVACYRIHKLSKGGTIGYKFCTEAIEWVSGWTEVSNILSPNEQKEMFRRKNIAAALYAIFEGKLGEAVAHFNYAFQEEMWPFGNLDALVQKIINFKSMGEETMKDSWERYDVLSNILNQVKPTYMSQKLNRSILSQYHVWAARSSLTENKVRILTYLLKAIWYDPQQLFSRKFHYNLFHAIFSKKVGV